MLVLVFLAASVPAFAESPIAKDRDVVSDALFARPLGLASIVGGAALWVVTFPFAALSGNLNTTTETLITNPIAYTFQRPVGDFDYVPVAEEDTSNTTRQE